MNFLSCVLAFMQMLGNSLMFPSCARVCACVGVGCQNLMLQRAYCDVRYIGILFNVLNLAAVSDKGGQRH